MKTEIEKLDLSQNDKIALSLKTICTCAAQIDMQSNWLVKNNKVDKRIAASITQAGYYCAEMRKRIIGNKDELEDSVLEINDDFLMLMEFFCIMSDQQRAKFINHVEQFKLD